MSEQHSFGFFIVLWRLPKSVLSISGSFWVCVIWHLLQLLWNCLNLKCVEHFMFFCRTKKQQYPFLQKNQAREFVALLNFYTRSNADTYLCEGNSPSRMLSICGDTFGAFGPHMPRSCLSGLACPWSNSPSLLPSRVLVSCFMLLFSSHDSCVMFHASRI